LQQQIAQAREKAELADLTEPRAKAAYYDPINGWLVVHLRYGASVNVPVYLIQGLAGATSAELADVEVTPAGIGLHWETLDVDISIPGLMAEQYGSAAWMAEIRDRHQTYDRPAASSPSAPLLTVRENPSTNYPAPSEADDDTLGSR
jgi:Protein of unknown function (DUF2442)